jgi:geranylgeranyl diphosphate synthase type I
VGAGGDPDAPIVADVGAALELLHAFALVHDDVMDGSDTRRGEASVHRRFADRHRAAAARGEARRFGEGAAILVGDFAFVYSDMLFASAPPEARPGSTSCASSCASASSSTSRRCDGARERTRAELIERYKSGKYTVERPLHLGAALAGRAGDLAAPLSAYGIPIGQAFQLRDDLLGVFGDPAVTGKPVGEDLRERKLTPLVAAAVARDPDLDGELDALGGDEPPDLARIHAVQERLLASGAVDEVEATIAALSTALTAGGRSGHREAAPRRPGSVRGGATERTPGAAARARLPLGEPSALAIDIAAMKRHEHPRKRTLPSAGEASPRPNGRKTTTGDPRGYRRAARAGVGARPRSLA